MGSFVPAVESLGKYALVGTQPVKPRDYWEIEAEKMVEGFSAVFKKPLIADWRRTVARANKAKEKKKISSINEANTRLEALKKRFKFGGFNVSHTQDEAVFDYARAQALRCAKFLRGWPERGATFEQECLAIIAISDICAFHKFEDLDDDQLLGLVFKGKIKDVLLRLQDEKWWLRRTRRTSARAIESICRELGFIARTRDIYCSKLGTEEHKRRKQANLNMMEHTVLENEVGDQYTLADLSDMSNANPEIRRVELMIRIAGFELWAKQLGYEAYFLTATCPSKFHAYKSVGFRNPKFDGSTQRDGQDHLCRVWSRFRSKAKRITKRKREEWDFFGFRIAEPHHDGTPHWHFLLFINPKHSEEAIGSLQDFALEEDRHEWGALDRRFDIEKIKTGINPDTGKEYSAAGYVAKYVSKSIDGEHVGKDSYGKDAKNSAESIVAWASRNGIRQFQQVGGPSVTAWRELRRLGRLSAEEQEDLSPLLKMAIQELEALNQESAAKAWHWYCCFANEHGLSIENVEKTIERTLEIIDRDYGEVYQVPSIEPQVNHYGELVTGIEGINVSFNFLPEGFCYPVEDEDLAFVNQRTRFHDWQIIDVTDAEAAEIRAGNVEKAAARKLAKQAATQALLESALDPALALDFAVDLRARNAAAVPAHGAAWTGVNNCTEGIGLKTETDQKQISFDLNRQ